MGARSVSCITKWSVVEPGIHTVLGQQVGVGPSFHLAAAISLAGAVELLDLPWLDLRTCCLRLDVPSRTAQAREDV